MRSACECPSVSVKFLGGLSDYTQQRYGGSCRQVNERRGVDFISQGCGCNVAIPLIDRRRANKQRKLVRTPDSDS